MAANEESFIWGGVGAIFAGGFLTAIEVIASTTFGVVPTALLGIGGLVMGVGIVEHFIPYFKK